MQMSDTKTTFQQWCIVELFGHIKIAGFCTEQNIAGSNMLRVDVPETNAHPAFTKFYGNAAIYAINPVDETTARLAADSFSVGPVSVWQAEAFVEKMKAQKEERLLENNSEEEDDFAITW